MDMSQYIEIFTEEAKEHLQALNECLLALEKSPEELKLLDEIFRSAHTLKGMSATMGFEKMAELTHLMENVLSKLRTGEEKVTPHVMDVLFKCLDSLEQMVQSIVDGEGGDIATDELIASLKRIEEGKAKDVTAEETAAALAEKIDEHYEKALESKEVMEIILNQYEDSIIKEAVRKGYPAFQIKVLIDESCLMKVARAFMVFRKVEELGEIVKAVPTVQEIEDEKFDNSFELLVITKQESEKVKHALSSIAEVSIAYVEKIKIGDADVKQATESKVMAEDKNDKAVVPSGAAVEKDSIRKTKAMQTVRVDIDRLDNLMNLVGELVISKTRLEQISAANHLAELNETIEHIDLITSDLQAVVMKVRMVPLEQVFNRFPRMVRDLAKELNKQVNLVIKGEDTELDRTVIDEIGDPLVHLLRNAIDHGIELPDNRLNKGKPAEATLKLEAWYEGNNVVIEVQDDGQGINPEVIKAKAIEKGVITQAEAQQLDDYAIINLIFQSGFSTANKVTDVSGRGVGLDAVRTKIDALNGSVNVETNYGQGSKFTIKLPLTLAIIQALLVQVGAETYAIPLSSIDETTHVTKQNIKRIREREVMLLRGNVLPLVRLDQYLGTPSSKEDTEEYYVVVVRKG
ncbi:MAG: chemotaxis protein CheA, partial [Bacillota bacterium]|nr:chemotaxis protein CheA [Bacillota bacterium]